MSQRAGFDAAAARFHVSVGPLKPGQQHSLVAEPLEPGEKVLTRNNGVAELTRWTPGGGCVLTFRVGDAFKEVTFQKSFGKALPRTPQRLTPQTPAKIPAPPLAAPDCG